MTESQRKMPDREKVIRGLECCGRWTEDELWDDVLCSGCPYVDTVIGCGHRLTADALALLREQEPVEPVVDARDGWYRCGKCGNSLASGERVRSFGSYKWPVYCEMCGRRIKWDD